MGAGELARALVGVALEIRARCKLLWSQRRKWRDDYVVLGPPIGEFASGRQHHLESRQFGSFSFGSLAHFHSAVWLVRVRRGAGGYAPERREHVAGLGDHARCHGSLGAEDRRHDHSLQVGRAARTLARLPHGRAARTLARLPHGRAALLRGRMESRHLGGDTPAALPRWGEASRRAF